MRNYSSCYIVIEPSLPESRKNGGLRYESNGKEKNRKDIIIFGSDIIGSLDAIANYLDVYIQYHIRNELLSSDKILPTSITWERYKMLLWDKIQQNKLKYSEWQ